MNITTEAQEPIRADLAAPSTPAEVEGLVADLSSCDTGMINLPIGYGEVRARIRKAITTLTALQADKAALIEARDMMGRLWEQEKARAVKAEAERDDWKANAETLAEAVSPFADVGVPSDPMSRINLTADREFVIAAREALAAHEKLKGDV